jgi:hypothetical protein
MGKLAGSVLPTAKYAGQTTLPPRIRPNAKRIVAKYGPYSMKGKGVRGLLLTSSVLIRIRRRSQKSRFRLIQMDKAS